MPARLRLVIAAMVLGTVLIAGAAISRVTTGGTGTDGAMLIVWSLLALTLLSAVIGFLADLRSRRRRRRSAEERL